MVSHSFNLLLNVGSCVSVLGNDRIINVVFLLGFVKFIALFARAFLVLPLLVGGMRCLMLSYFLLLLGVFKVL